METTQKLPEDFKQKWVAALRSGEYKQGTGNLYNKSNNSYCCLGVACKIANVIIPDGYYYIPLYEAGGELSANVPNILKGSGIIPTTLAQMNDGYRSGDIKKHSFAEIADYIEKNL